MEELRTISDVTKALGVSTRTLRYYEQIGLLASRRVEDYAYRVYDEAAYARLRQIIILRQLRIPLKRIALLLRDGTASEAIALFQRNIDELDAEVDSLSTIRSILQKLVDQLRESATPRLSEDLLADVGLLSTLAATPFQKKTNREETTMEDLHTANEAIHKLTDRNVRIVYLPPSDVAAYQYEGDEPEHHALRVIDRFVRESGLARRKPDLRHYGFNSPNQVGETDLHGYEMWVTIPEGMDVPAPLVKKRFEGGIFGAHMIPMGAFEEWGWLFAWAKNSEKYECRGDWNQQNMFGCLEESLNYVNRVELTDQWTPEMPVQLDTQLDLLIPVREKK